MKRLVMSIVFLVCCWCTGCGSGTGVVPVTGTVTFNGQPATECEVMFVPASGRPGSAITDSQGKFRLSTFSEGDGGVLGVHKVTICEHYPAGKAPPMGATLPSRFPAKYADPTQSPFTANVESGGKNDFTFDMTE